VLIRHRIVLCLISIVLCAGFHADLTAQESLKLPLGVRSYGMGETGTADEYDISNVYFNPAVISFFPGGHVAGSHREYKAPGSTGANVRNLVAGGGYQWNTGEGRKAGFGAGFVVANVSYGEFTGTDTEGHEIGPIKEIDRTISVVIGGDYWPNENIGFSVGLAPKFWKRDFSGADPEVSFDGTLWDVGALITTKHSFTNGYNMVANLGIGYINSGKEMDGAGMANNPPTMLRTGLGLRIASPSRPSFDEKFHAVVPLWGLAFNFDYQDRTEASDLQLSYLLGLEANLLRVVFLRYGYVIYDQWDDNTEGSYGMGLGTTYKRFVARFDYARTEPGGGADPVNHYGLYVAYFM